MLCFFKNVLLIKESRKKVSHDSNIDNKSELHKMYFKVYKKIDQINAGLMSISDFLQKYKIVMYPNFWPIIIIIIFFTFEPLPLPPTLCAAVISVLVYSMYLPDLNHIDRIPLIFPHKRR